MAGITVIPPQSDLTDPNAASHINDLMQNFQNDQFYIDEVTGNIGINKSSNIGTVASFPVGGVVTHIDGGSSYGNIIIEGEIGGRLILADSNAAVNSKIVGLLQNGTNTYLRQYNDDGSTKLDPLIVDEDGKIATGGEPTPEVVPGGIHYEIDGTTGDVIVVKDGTTKYFGVSNLGNMTLSGYIATGGETSPDVVAGGIHIEASATGDAFVVKNGATEYASITNLGAASFAGGMDAGANGTVLKTKVIEIGDWNMVSSPSVDVPHGLSSDYKNIRNAYVVIRDDNDSQYRPLDRMGAFNDGEKQGSILDFDSTNIGLTRLDTGVFNNILFDSTSYNRGWVTIEYEA